MQEVASEQYEEAMRYSLDEDDTDQSPHEAPPRRSLRSDRPGKYSNKSKTSLELKVAANMAGQTPSPGNSSIMPSRATLPTPLKLNLGPVEEDENDTSLVLQHSDDEDGRDSPVTPRTPVRANSTPGKQSTAEKAGIILGIHNVYIVLPQFVVTAMSSIIFKIMEPPAGTGVGESHPLATGPDVLDVPAFEEGALTDGDVAGEFLGNLLKRVEGAVEGGSSDAVGLIFR